MPAVSSFLGWLFGTSQQEVQLALDQQRQEEVQKNIDGVRQGVRRVEQALICQERRQDTVACEPNDSERHLQQAEEGVGQYESCKVEIEIIHNQRARKALQTGICCPCYYFLYIREIKLLKQQRKLYEKEQQMEQERAKELAKHAAQIVKEWEQNQKVEMLREAVQQEAETPRQQAAPQKEDSEKSFTVVGGEDCSPTSRSSRC